jgi:hypothetical protein
VRGEAVVRPRRARGVRPPRRQLRVYESNGSFSFTFIETGTYTVDFEDPALSDQTSQFTGANHFTLAPGGVVVLSQTWHDFPTGLRIWERVHLTEVNGEPVVEREFRKVTGCP